MNSQPAFDETGQPTQVVDFDYEDLFARLDGREPAPEERQAHLWEWLVSPKAVAYYGRAWQLRNVALAYVAGRCGAESLGQIAARYGVSKQILSKYAAQASRVYGVRNRAQLTHGGRWHGPQKMDATGH